MKPWEHDWHVDESGTLIRDERDCRIAEAIELDIPPQEHGNARLAAAAPEMARLIAECVWFPHDSYAYPNETKCISCRETQEEGHRKDCKLMAVMAKAGIWTTPKSREEP